jgi:predicted transcriptional regulator
MGRPKSDNPKSVQVTARLDAETVEKLDECAQALEITKAQVIRKGIEIIHDGLKK